MSSAAVKSAFYAQSLCFANGVSQLPVWEVVYLVIGFHTRSTHLAYRIAFMVILTLVTYIYAYPSYNFTIASNELSFRLIVSVVSLSSARCPALPCSGWCTTTRIVQYTVDYLIMHTLIMHKSHNA